MPRRAGILVALAALAALAIAGCGPEAVASPSPSDAPIPTPTVTQYQLNTSVWYAGLVIAFTSATATFEPGGGTVTIVAQFQNPGSEDQTLSAPIQITDGTQTFDPVHGTEMPIVPAGGTAALLLTFDVAGLPSVDGGELRVGPPETNHAVIPFTSGTASGSPAPGAPALTTLQPVALNLKGTANASDLRVSLTAGELRWDLPDWADELPFGTAALTLTYTATYRGSFGGGLAFTADNVSLRLPDGATVSPRRDGRSQSVTLLLPGKPQAGLSSRFEVPSSERGTYVLTIANGGARASISFSLPH